MASCKQVPLVVVLAFAGACERAVGLSDVTCLGESCDASGAGDLEGADAQPSDAFSGDLDSGDSVDGDTAIGDPLPGDVAPGDTAFGDTALGDPFAGDLDGYCTVRADCPPCYDCDVDRCSIQLDTDSRCDPISCDAHDRTCRDYGNLASDQCSLGFCVTNPSLARCDLGGTFTNTTVGTTCSNGFDLCRYGDACDGYGICISGTTITCTDDAGTCGADRSCNGTNTCTLVYPDNSVACDDLDPCTFDDQCDNAGGCIGTSLLCADEPGPCGANRSCNGTSSCDVTYPDSTISCDDGDPCTYGDHCNGLGACTPAGTVTCDDDPGICSANRSCDGTASCAITYPGSATPCDDTNPCTTGDSCDSAGSCNPGTPCANPWQWCDTNGCRPECTFWSRNIHVLQCGVFPTGPHASCLEYPCLIGYSTDCSNPDDPTLHALCVNGIYCSDAAMTDAQCSSFSDAMVSDAFSGSDGNVQWQQTFSQDPGVDPVNGGEYRHLKIYRSESTSCVPRVGWPISNELTLRLDPCLSSGASTGCPSQCCTGSETGGICD